MEGAAGPNIAQIASMQQYAGDDGGGVSLLDSLMPTKGVDVSYLGAAFGNVDQLGGAFLNQSMMMGGCSSFLGKDPGKGMIGLALLGKQAGFDLNADHSSILGVDDGVAEYESGEYAEAHDPGVDMLDSGMQFGGDTDHIQPPSDTPMMDQDPILDHGR